MLHKSELFSNIRTKRVELRDNHELLSGNGSLFISYAHADDASFAEKLHKDLKDQGVNNVFLDKESLENKGGRYFRDEISEAVVQTDCLLLVMGPEAAKRANVIVEWRKASEYPIPILLLLRKGDISVIPEELQHLQFIDCTDTHPYEESFKAIIDSLNNPVKYGQIHGLPERPKHFQFQADQREKLERLIFADAFGPDIVTANTRVNTIVGTSGSGKTTLAASFARDLRTREHAKDGVFWLEFTGNEADQQQIVKNIESVIRKLGDFQYSSHDDIEAASIRLSEMLCQKKCLLVLDNVWDKDQIEPFVNALSQSDSRILVTTQRNDLATVISENRGYPIETMSNNEAKTLLLAWAGIKNPNLYQIDADALVEHVGRNPLALSMLGAVINGDPINFRKTVDQLKKYELTAIHAPLLLNYDRSLVGSIAIGVESLSELDKRYKRWFSELSVFQKGSSISKEALRLLWKRDVAKGGQKKLDHDINQFINVLVDRSLARRDADGRVTLLDLQYDYARSRFIDENSKEYSLLHERLVTEYAKLCSGGWDTGPDDGYFFEHLAYHLASAQLNNELAKLLQNFRWIKVKSEKKLYESLRTDFGNHQYIKRVNYFYKVGLRGDYNRDEFIAFAESRTEEDAAIMLIAEALVIAKNYEMDDSQFLGSFLTILRERSEKPKKGKGASGVRMIEIFLRQLPREYNRHFNVDSDLYTHFVQPNGESFNHMANNINNVLVSSKNEIYTADGRIIASLKDEEILNVQYMGTGQLLIATKTGLITTKIIYDNDSLPNHLEIVGTDNFESEILGIKSDYKQPLWVVWLKDGRFIIGNPATHEGTIFRFGESIETAAVSNDGHAAVYANHKLTYWYPHDDSKQELLLPNNNVTSIMIPDNGGGSVICGTSEGQMIIWNPGEAPRILNVFDTGITKILITTRNLTTYFVFGADDGRVGIAEVDLTTKGLRLVWGRKLEGSVQDIGFLNDKLSLAAITEGGHAYQWDLTYMFGQLERE